MPWKCPACGSVLRHNELDPKPRAGERYRCHICRLSLDFDPNADRLVVTPLEADHQSSLETVERARALPPPVTAKSKSSRRK